MDLFTLSASLGLDTSSFEAGIDFSKRILVGFGKAVLDFGKDVIETGMGFDRQMSAVRAVMGLTEDTADNLDTMNKLREFALEQARDSIFTAEETATAYYYMGMAGWRAEQMTAGLPGIMALAAASGEDLKMTSDMVTDSLTAFGLGAGQASHFADVLAVTATNANTDVARMQMTFKNLAPIAGALGYSIEDVALSVGLIANSGIKGSQAGTALRNIFTRIATNAGATSKTLGALQIVTDELGVSFYTSEGRARPWGEVLADLRAAWNKLDPDKVDKVTAAFGQFSANSQSAGEIMAEFANDLDTWTTEWNGLTTSVEREQFVAQLEPQFAALGISMRDSNGQLREFSEVAKDARAKLGGLTDQEQIYFGKQIGSLRGISGWLALMTASEEDVKQLTTAIQNADGAAKDMANTRLDNLWGDVVHFNSVLDTLKVAIFDDVKGPLREIVQWASGALEDITKAVNENGLAGGIDVLSKKISEAGDMLAPIMESFGEALGPLVVSLVETVTPQLIEAGKSIGAGLFSGLSEGFSGGGTIFTLLGGLLGGIVNPGSGAPRKLDLTSLISGGEVTADVAATFKSQQIQEALNEAQANGESTVTIDGIEFLADEDAAEIAKQLGYIGLDAAQPMSDNLYSQAIDQAPGVAGTLSDTLGTAGEPAGAQIANDIAQKLRDKNYGINVHANVYGLPNGVNVHHNASAMYAGRIYRTPTIFGYADGAYQEVGDAGPEAVIGTNSLSNLITNAVRRGNQEREIIIPRDTGRDITIVLELDRQQFAKAVYKANNQETQRIGVRLANGGAY